MARKFNLISEFLGYVSAPDPTNTDDRFLIAGSQNVLIDFQKKVKIRPGYSRLGTANAAILPILKGWTWLTSTGSELGQRNYNGVLEAYLGTVDTTVINAWTRITGGFSATKKVRPAVWFDSTEGIDVQVMANGDPNIYEWNGAVAVVGSVSSAAGIITVLAAAPTAAGTGYNVGDIVTITTGGTLATAKVLTVTGGTGAGAVSIAVLSAGVIGSGYVAGDFINIVGGGGTGAIVAVDTVGVGGTISTYHIIQGGTAYSTQSRVSTSGGSGTGALFDITSDALGAVATLSLVTPGSGYTTGAGKATSGGTGAGLTVAITTVATGSITKAGTTTFGQNRFYNARNRTVTCVRTGTQYTYTNGAGTTSLIGVGDTSGLVAGDIIVQTLVVKASFPGGTRTTNDTIMVYQNQLYLGSLSDPDVYISKNTDYTNFAFSSPRVSGEGALLTLDGISAGMGVLTGFPMMFAGLSSIFKVTYQTITVGAVQAEAVSVTKLKSGNGQGSISPDAVVSVGNGLAFITNEPALRIITSPENVETDIGTISSARLESYSNPIKPDFDNETWTNAEALWNKNELFIAAPASSHVYILEFIEDPETGKERRYWQPPQIIPVQSFAVIAGILYGHSNVVPETYRIFDFTQGYSDLSSADDKLPINAIAVCAYRNYKDREILKNFDEFYVEGEISAQTNDLALTLNYGWQGTDQAVQKVIDGTDQDILQNKLSAVSIGQDSMGGQPIAGNTQAPPDAKRFSVDFEVAREDFDQLGIVFSSNNTDRYWAITASGPNVAMSNRRNIPIRK